MIIQLTHTGKLWRRHENFEIPSGILGSLFRFCGTVYNLAAVLMGFLIVLSQLLNKYCDYYYYYLTLLVIYECLNILAMYRYNLHPAQTEEDWPPLRARFLSRFLPKFQSF